ncbi:MULTISPECIES: AEC family transporter [Rhodopseudomonas]|uniref:Transporter n=1 Tax=Rhodopseudomonas palustris TaxID=1076 RepID=A0A0D7E7U1_RHOPL|nr:MULTISPECIES: AEC family transporter [Rhodopseudomonas]KIZ36555.1 transporter [Rhodopseudomonas palustris]MDF3810896.1 AEC family transporter [Rhodopseudomonas sp. BAL398]WOK19326.1 AEC family transporter [Rhodopseudomonas sp. BAL398]
MLTVFGALVPVFLLIVLGYVLRRVLLKQDLMWTGLEHLVYYVLFPALLVDTLSRANLASAPIAGVGGALLLAVIAMAALCLALRPWLARGFNVDGPAFSSVFQGSTRWQTFVALSVAGNLWGDRGITLASVAMVAMIPLLNVLAVWVLAHYAAPQRMSWPKLLLAIIRNPLIWACIVGLAINLSHLPVPGPLHEFADALGRCSLALGLLLVGAGLHLEGLRRPRAAAGLTVVLKLVLLPLMAIGCGHAFGLSGVDLAIVACCASVPSASNGYILARQMGGDAPLLAQILTMQTILAVVTMPLLIALAG